MKRAGPPPCQLDIGCAKGTIDGQKVLTPRNEKAVDHFMECRAVGQFPDDAQVRRNARIIDETERALDRQDTQRVAQMVEFLAVRQH